MTAPDHSVLTIGEALIDIVIPHGGGDTTEHVGGSPANVAIGLAALDHDSRLTAYIGKDERGQRIIDHLLDRDVVLTPGSTDADRTPTATATLDADAVATYEFDMEWRVGPQDLNGVGHLNTGSIACTLEPGGSALVEIMSQIRETGTVSYDPNCRPTIMGAMHQARQRMEECISLSDVIKASLEDIEWLYGDRSREDVARHWGQLGAAMTIITGGESGALIYLTGADLDIYRQPLPTTLVDTVGAGDSFMSGLLSGLLDAGLLGSAAARQRLQAASEADVDSALNRALTCAAWTVAQTGAAAPTRADLQDYS